MILAGESFASPHHCSTFCRDFSLILTRTVRFHAVAMASVLFMAMALVALVAVLFNGLPAGESRDDATCWRPIFKEAGAHGPPSVFDAFGRALFCKPPPNAPGLRYVTLFFKVEEVVEVRRKGRNFTYHPISPTVAVDLAWRYLTMQGFEMRPLDGDMNRDYTRKFGSQSSYWIRMFIENNKKKGKKEMPRFIPLYVSMTDVRTLPEIESESKRETNAEPLSAGVDTPAPPVDTGDSQAHASLVSNLYSRIRSLISERDFWKEKAESRDRDVVELTKELERERKHHLFNKEKWAEERDGFEKRIGNLTRANSELRDREKSLMAERDRLSGVCDALFTHVADLKRQLDMKTSETKDYYQKYLELRIDLEDQKFENRDIEQTARDLETRLGEMGALKRAMEEGLENYRVENQRLTDAVNAGIMLRNSETSTSAADNASAGPASKQERESSDAYQTAVKEFAVVKEKFGVSDAAFHEIYMLGKKYGYVLPVSLSLSLSRSRSLDLSISLSQSLSLNLSLSRSRSLSRSLSLYRTG